MPNGLHPTSRNPDRAESSAPPSQTVTELDKVSFRRMQAARDRLDLAMHICSHGPDTTHQLAPQDYLVLVKRDCDLCIRLLDGQRALREALKEPEENFCKSFDLP